MIAMLLLNQVPGVCPRGNHALDYPTVDSQLTELWSGTAIRLGSLWRLNRSSGPSPVEVRTTLVHLRTLWRPKNLGSYALQRHAPSP